MKNLIQKAAETVAQQAADSDMSPAQIKAALAKVYEKLAQAKEEAQDTVEEAAGSRAAVKEPEQEWQAPPAAPRRGRPRKAVPPSDLDARFETLTFLRQHPEKSIKKDKVICLECGTPFKALSTRHLRLHGLERDSYLEKWNLGANETLISEVSLRRKEKALAEARAQRARHLGRPDREED